jgi:hypothetical protein
MADDDKDLDVKKVTKVISFALKYWHVIGLAISFIVGAYVQFQKFSDIEKKHDPEQIIAQSYYRKTDSLYNALRWMKQHQDKQDSRLDKDDEFIDDIHDYKLPYHTWGTPK